MKIYHLYKMFRYFFCWITPSQERLKTGGRGSITDHKKGAAGHWQSPSAERDTLKQCANILVQKQNLNYSGELCAIDWLQIKNQSFPSYFWRKTVCLIDWPEKVSMQYLLLWEERLSFNRSMTDWLGACWNMLFLCQGRKASPPELKAHTIWWWWIPLTVLYHNHLLERDLH